MSTARFFTGADSLRDAAPDTSSARYLVRMARGTTQQTAPTPTAGERRHWHEVPDNFPCPIIGSCLSLREQRILLEKCKKLEKGMSDYEIHAALVNSSSPGESLGERLESALERRYRKEIAAWGRCPEEELLSRWEEGLRTGEIGAILWIAATHPDLSGTARYRILGEFHMFLHRQAEVVKEALKDAEREKIEHGKMERRYAEAQARIRELNRRLEARENLRELPAAEGRDLDSLTPQRPDEKLSEALVRNSSLLAAKEHLARKLKTAEEENLELWAEVKAIRQEHEAFRETECGSDCPDACPNRSLCDKRVLVVGGMTRSRAIYQKLIEEMGGKFRHHDGRATGGGRLLEGHIDWADIVLCPVDINSHSACLTVKKLCEKTRKPYRMLTRSGLGSLARSLDEVTISLSTKK